MRQHSAHGDDVEAVVRETLRDEPAVAAAYVFGSVARGTAGPLSDIDVALLVDDLRQRQAVCGRMTDALSRRLRAPRVDVISLADAPVPLRHRVVRDGRLVLRRDARLHERFVAETILQYLDFKPLRDRAFARMRDAILEDR
jgi:predicted nucleotidyltransferase